MKIVFFAHPDFLISQSMPRFAKYLAEGMKDRGHTIEIWKPTPFLRKLTVPNSLKKWLGYFDQYIVFPGKVRGLIKACPADTLFVFTDHALGPWVPLVKSKPHVIHCHDFLAQNSALGGIQTNSLSWTGTKYQEYIRRGYSTGKNFISVSNKTNEELLRFLADKPQLTEVVYNGLNANFKPHPLNEARAVFQVRINIDLDLGYILHVGGNQWYKNRIGVIEIYNKWRLINNSKIPLLLLGAAPSAGLIEEFDRSVFKTDIHFLTGIEDHIIPYAYSGATVFLFPSLAEGFGWPIAEAMASGIPVITTNEAPMTEVTGNAAFLIPRKPIGEEASNSWAEDAAKVLDEVIKLSDEKRMEVINQGLVNIQRFDAESALNKIEGIYKRVIELST